MFFIKRLTTTKSNKPHYLPVLGSLAHWIAVLVAPCRNPLFGRRPKVELLNRQVLRLEKQQKLLSTAWAITTEPTDDIGGRGVGDY